MTISIQKKLVGYSKENLNNSPLVNINPIVLIGQGLEKVPKFDDNHHPISGTTEKTRLEVYYPKFGTMKISLPAEYRLPKLTDLEKIQLLNGEAFVNCSGQIYIRATGVTRA